MKDAPPSLISRLIRWQAAAMALTWVALLLWLIYQMVSVADGDLDRRLGYFAHMLADTAADTRADPVTMSLRLRSAEQQFLAGVVETIDSFDRYVPAYQVLDRRNNILLRTGAVPDVPLLVAPGLSDARIDRRHFRVMSARSHDGAVTVVAVESNAMRRAATLPILGIVAGSQLVTLCVSIFALWWAAHRGFRPVRLLAEEVGRRAPGDLSAVGAKASYRELTPLIDAFNDLLAREALRLDQERNFLADAAHELRTPLAVLSAQAHQLADSSDPIQRVVAADQLQRGVKRLSHLLSQLLTMARLDSSPPKAPTEILDIAELVRLRIALLVPLARKKSMTLQLHAPDNLVLPVNSSALSSIIDNLVDNAIRYTPEGGRVAITLTAAEHRLRLLVQDNGPGIATALHERAFERFYRVPGSQEEGSGLGLAIVRQLSNACGADVELVTGLEGRGLGVIIRYQ